MNWVRIEEGCEMPINFEIVLISDGDDFKEACYVKNYFRPVDAHGYVGMSNAFEGATHWARVELPNN